MGSNSPRHVCIYVYIEPIDENYSIFSIYCAAQRAIIYFIDILNNPSIHVETWT